MTIHHIEGYKGTHDLKELIMLCSQHHREADSSKITKDELYALKTNPFNKYSVKHGFQVESSKELVVHIGGNLVIDTPIVLQLRGEPVVSVRREGTSVLFSTKLYGKDGVLRLEMIDNVWEVDTALADVRYSESPEVQAWLAVKLEDSEPYADLKVVRGELFIKGKFYLRGNLLEVRDDGCFILNESQFFTGCTFKAGRVGIAIG